MLARLDDPSLSQTPRVKELKRGQLEDSLGFYREVVKDREDQGPAVRLDVAEAYIQAGYNQTQLNRSAEGREQLTKALAILERSGEGRPIPARLPVCAGADLSRPGIAPCSVHSAHGPGRSLFRRPRNF